jgi:hypothetical protein
LDEKEKERSKGVARVGVHHARTDGFVLLQAGIGLAVSDEPARW